MNTANVLRVVTLRAVQTQKGAADDGETSDDSACRNLFSDVRVCLLPGKLVRMLQIYHFFVDNHLRLSSIS